MTVQSNLSKHIYEGNGVTTEFPFTFPITAATDIKVYYQDVVGTLSLLISGYTVNWTEGDESGTVTYPAASGAVKLQTGCKLVLMRICDIVQLLDISKSNGFKPSALESALDLLTMIVQQLSEGVERAVKVPVTSDVTVEGLMKQVLSAGSTATSAASVASGARAAAEAAAAITSKARDDVKEMFSFSVAGNIVYWEPDGEGNLRVVPEAKWGRGLPLPLPAPTTGDELKLLRINAGRTAFEYAAPESGTGMPTRQLRRLMMPQHNFGLRRYSWTSVPAIDGTTGGSTVPICRINLHGFGFQGESGSRAFGRVKIAVGCVDVGITLELTIYREGTSWRIDKQAFLGGSSDADSYYAYSRGSAFKPNQDGWLLALGQTENNSEIIAKHAHYIGAAGAEWSYPPVFWPSQSEWDITHYHQIAVPYKINKTISGVEKRSAEDIGSDPDYLNVAVYTDAGVHMSDPYTTHSTEWIELRVTNLPQITGVRPLVNTVMEFADCNHTVWFYDSEKSVWETPPVVAVTGDSAVEGTDHRDLVFFNYSDAYYGSVYRHAWTEKRGYWNYAWDGSMMIQMLGRMRIVDGDLQLENKETGWSDSKGFTHVILGVGANEAVERVLRRRGRTNRYNLVGWDGDYLSDFIAMVDKIKSATARNIQPVLLLHSGIWDAQAVIDTGGNYGPLVDMETGLEVSGDYMTVDDWNGIATEFGTVTDTLYAYAMANGIPVIDWYTLSEWHKFNDDAGTFMTSAGHYSLNGLLTVANYADIKRRV